MITRTWTLLAVWAVGCAAPAFATAGDAPQAPFDYVWAKAYRVIPETTSEESGYFSLCEGLNGKVYVGPAKYQVNACLVEFDPQTEQQKIVLDTNKLCGLNAKGYAAQTKFHTRNYVGPSGAIYVGSMEGYRLKGDESEYPGGYLLTYDPAEDRGECLGMPYPGEGIIDVSADEERGLIYVITSMTQRWLVYDMKSGDTRELGIQAASWSVTLLDRRGRASALTVDSRLAQHDPDTGKTVIRHVVADGVRLDGLQKNPVWRLAPDGRTAWLVRLSDPTLVEIDLLSEGDALRAKVHGRMIEGRRPDCRAGLDVGPDGRVWAVIRVDNQTGFGDGMLHHLTRFDPNVGRMEDLGVLAVKNPDFFDFGPDQEGNRPPQSHGYHRLPDGTLTPLHCHMAMVVGHDNTVYVTIIYPFTLLRITGFQARAGG